MSRILRKIRVSGDWLAQLCVIAMLGSTQPASADQREAPDESCVSLSQFNDQASGQSYLKAKMLSESTPAESIGGHDIVAGNRVSSARVATTETKIKVTDNDLAFFGLVVGETKLICGRRVAKK